MIRTRVNKLIGFFQGEGLRSLAMRSAIWTFMGFGVSNALRLASNLILTRLLVPEMFGLMALANVFVTGLTLMSDVGTTASVVRSDRGEDPAFLRTVWTVQVIRGFLIAGVACALAWPASQIYEEPVLFPLICVMAGSAVLRGFQSVSFAVMNRKMHVFHLTLLNTATQATTICVTVAMAYVLESVWALAIGTVFGSGLNLAMSHTFLPRFAHRLKIERAALGEIIHFGRWILLGTMCTYMGGQGVQALQGLLVPIDILGVIAIATLVGRLPGQLVQKILSTVAFPSFSKVRRNNPERLPEVLLKVRLVIIGVTLPLFFGLALLSQPLIDLLYDPRYAAAGFILALLLAEDAIAALSAPYQNIMLSEGNSRFHAFVMLFWAVSRVLGLFVGFKIAGILGMLVGMAVGSVLMFLLSGGLAWWRGYASKGLDIMVLGVSMAFYVFILLSADAPAQLLPPPD